jgi:hypothetical protein
MKTFRITHHSGRTEEVQADRYREYKQLLIFQEAGSPVVVYERKALLMVDEETVVPSPANGFPARHLLALPAAMRV